MTDDVILDAFGYLPAVAPLPVDMVVADAKQAESLEPAVAVLLQFVEEAVILGVIGSVHLVALTPDQADAMAAQLEAAAAVARARHFAA